MTEARKSKVTPAKDWKSAQEEVIELPSGNVARVMRHNMYVLRKTGQVPEFVRKVMDDAEEASVEQRQAAIEWRLAFAFIEPKVVTGEPKEGELSIDDISDPDKAKMVEYLGVSLGF